MCRHISVALVAPRTLLTWCVLLLLGIPTIATAQVTVWSGTWPGDEVDGIVTIYGASSATASEYGDLLIYGWIEDPVNNAIDEDSNSGWATYLDVPLEVQLSEHSLEGQYDTKGFAYFNGEPYGCGLQDWLTAFRNYYYWKYGETSTHGSYTRCNPGICTDVNARKSHFGGTAPGFASLTILTITIGPARTCWAIKGSAQSRCYPD